MIRSWRVKNFKSIQDGMDNLEFGAITLFAGANSSGKSSVIQSILLLMQSLSTSTDTPLVLNGELVSLGTVEDLWHNGLLPLVSKPERRLEYECVIDNLSEEGTQLWMKVAFEPIATTKVQVVEAAYRLSDSAGVFTDAVAIVHRDAAHKIMSVTDTLKLKFFGHLERQGLQNIASLRGSAVQMDGFLPRTIAIHAKAQTRELNWATALVDPNDERLSDEDLGVDIQKDHFEVLKQTVRKLKLPHFTELDNHNRPVERVRTLRDYRTWYAGLQTAQRKDLRYRLTQKFDDLVTDEYAHYAFPQLDSVETSLRELFSRRIRYLSANRLAPTIIFTPDASSHWSEVGINGANVAGALQEYGNSTIQWYHPQELESRETSLNEAVITWLQFLHLVEAIETEERGKLGTLLKIRSSGVNRDLDLTAVGFGTSQILPILVQGLLTPPGGVFIVEQPEVHLHPHVQSQLALFFVALTRANVQCIIETHSENIVNQLRLFIAGRREHLRDQIKIYFAEREPDTGTYLRAIEIDRRGNIVNWPRGFMDESTHQAEAMLRAILESEDE